MLSRTRSGLWVADLFSHGLRGLDKLLSPPPVFAAYDAHANGAYSVVAVAPSPATSGTSLTLSAGDGSLFPAPATDGAFNMSVWPSGQVFTKNNGEIVRVTARSGDVLTIARTQEGTSARSIVIGDQVALAPTAKHFTDMERAVGAYDAPAVSASVANTAAAFNIFTPGSHPAGDLRPGDGYRQVSTYGWANLDGGGATTYHLVSYIHDGGSTFTQINDFNLLVPNSTQYYVTQDLYFTAAASGNNHICICRYDVMNVSTGAPVGSYTVIISSVTFNLAANPHQLYNNGQMSRANPAVSYARWAGYGEVIRVRP